MAERQVNTRRYVLDKREFRTPDDVRKYRPAMVSVIGHEPVAEFEGLLEGLNYEVGRFITSEHYKSAATWKKWGNFKIPTGMMSLIFITTEAEATLEELASEVAQYEEQCGTILIAWPGRTQFGRQMMKQLALANSTAHFVRLCSSQPVGRQPEGNWGQTLMRHIEALLVADTYPGMVWLDPLAIMTSFGSRRQSTRVFHFEGRTFKKLMDGVAIDLRAKSNYPNVLATLICPASLKMAHMGKVTRFVNASMPHAAPVLFAAFADSARNNHTLYLTLFE